MGPQGVGRCGRGWAMGWGNILLETGGGEEEWEVELWEGGPPPGVSNDWIVKM